MRKTFSSDTKASPGQTDAKVQIFLQTQTSCRLEISIDDYVAAVTIAVAAHRCRKQRITSINQLALVLGLVDEEDAIVFREHICSFCNVRRAAVTSSVQIIRSMLLEAACTVLFAWHVAALELHLCGCASLKRLKTTCCATPRL